MGLNVPTYAQGGLSTVDSFRDPSNTVWRDCPWDEIDNKFMDDFIMTGNPSSSSGAALAGSLGQWTAYTYQGGTIEDHQAEGGVVRLASDGDAEGIAMLSSTGSFRMLTTSTLALNQRLWFECRVARSTVTTDQIEFFAGLMKPTLSSGLPAAAQPITVTDDTLMTAGDLFGFHSNSNTATRGGPTEVAAAFVLASGTVNYPTNLTTMMASSGNSVLTAGTFVKLGFIFDPNGPRKRITSATARQTAGQVKRALVRFFVNGLECPTFLTSDDVVNATAGQAFPTAFMCPTVAILNTATSSPGYLAVDWVKVAQAPNS